MKDLITDMAKALVDQPDQVTVTEIEGGQTVVFELSVAKSDMGKVIGILKERLNYVPSTKAIFGLRSIA